eukprot:TRINITY_DN4260_c0_g1_i1.p1 TRINITY_DN4260_c0_g1~~TRINITY_DN4260_c0_g1_i1.p1  ORF type:complete len:326 (-),score=58.40 TRINITY_DN4260_c0_g1_i1:4-981(-)
MRASNLASEEAIISALAKTAPVNALAGAGGGVISFFLTYPLSTISTRLAAARNESTATSSPSHHNKASPVGTLMHILKTEGFTGLYSGLSSGLFGVAVSQGVYYYFYQWFRVAFEKRRNGAPLGDLMNLLVASLAGAATVLISNPIWVVNTRMMLEKKKSGAKSSSISTALQIINREGITALWSGLVPALILVSNPAIQYAVFEKMKGVLEKRNTKLTSTHFFLLGAFGKAVATLCTYPYLVVKTRLQMAQKAQSDEDRYRGTVDVLVKILQNEGIPGFFKGLSSKIVQSVLNAAFLFVAKEELVTVFAWIAFFLIRRRLAQQKV